MTGAGEGREWWDAAGLKEQQVQRLLLLHHRWGDNTVQTLSPDENLDIQKQRGLQGRTWLQLR